MRDSGQHGHYGSNPCVTEKIDNDLINGVLPPSRSECAGDPRPQVPADGTRTARNTKEARVHDAVQHRSIWR
ncbi:hypothetical protein [Actinophytocola sp.]|uniref:hypothetical protein n=1 Tax=Actinophytocola sp. TaxID=1872138 RepID=UPI002ED21157